MSLETVEEEDDEPLDSESPAPETVPSSPLTTPRPLQYGAGYYTWMAASLVDQAEATARVQAYRAMGFNSNVASRQVDGRRFYGVTLGLFESRSQAERARAELPDDVRSLPDLWLLPLE